MKIIFDDGPGPKSGRFVEVENDKGESIRAGEWSQRPDGLWQLKIEEKLPEIPMTYCPHGSVICALCNYIPESWKPQI